MPKTHFLPTSTTPAKFLEISPVRMVVVDDDQFDQEVRASNSEPIDLDGTDYLDLANLGLAVGWLPGAAVGLVVGGALEVGSWLWSRGERPYSLVSRSTCSKVNFPHGHPRNKVVYVRHPLVKNIYYPLAEFHQHLFQHKHLEAVELLKSLGAKSIEVSHEAGWSQDQVGKLSTPVGATGVTAGTKLATKRKSSAASFFAAKFNPPKVRSVPKGLVWFPTDPDWQRIADQVLNGSLTEFELVVSSSESYGIDASIQAELASLKFEVGGEFQDYRDTKWTIKAVFPKPRKKKIAR